MPNSHVESMREHMRMRPGMYIGGAGSRGIRHILDEIVTQLLDAPGADLHCIRCVLGSNRRCTVEFLGELPDVIPEYFNPAMLEGTTPRHFDSLGIASGFSEQLLAEIVRNGRQWIATFTAGIPIGPIRTAPSLAPTGLTIHYTPDHTIFNRDAAMDFLTLCGRAREWAALHSQVKITLEDEESGQRRDFHYPQGLLSLAREIEQPYDHQKPWHFRAEEPDGSRVEVALMPRAGSGANVYSFVNGRMTHDGGAHVHGLRSGVDRVLYSSPQEKAYRRRFNRDPLEGMLAIVSIYLADPEYGGPTRDQLDDKRAQELVHRVVVREFGEAITNQGHAGGI